MLRSHHLDVKVAYIENRQLNIFSKIPTASGTCMIFDVKKNSGPQTRVGILVLDIEFFCLRKVTKKHIGFFYRTVLRC